MKRLVQLEQSIILNLMYFLGIGLPAIVGKFLGKTFLNTRPKITTWLKHKPTHSDKTMY